LDSQLEDIAYFQNRFPLLVDGCWLLAEEEGKGRLLSRESSRFGLIDRKVAEVK
jgi:hypothetical protein